ncbi:MAG: hypothetical protein RLZZ298_1515 [Pseudomonadota bacterium]|jgi:type I restriction enzyme S subunit
MRYSPYPAYKPSRLPWLAEIPNEWGIHRLKWSVTGCDNGVWGEEPDGGEDDIVCLRVADFDRNSLRVSTSSLTVRSVDARQRGSRKINKHDLLLEKSGGGEKQLVGCVVHFDHDFDAVCSNFVARMVVATGLSPKFWSYVHAALYAGKLNYLAIKQTTGIQNLDSGEYLNTLVAYPSEVEQVQIAAFLDWKTGQIDALIAKKQALVGKLKEKRLAVITQAVTKGLDPSVPLRDSGIPWLGKVPKHWQQKRLKWAIMFQRGHDLPADARNHGEVPLVSSSGVSALHDIAIAKGPGIVTGRYGTIGVFHLVEEDYWPLNTTLYSIDLYNNNPRFLCSLLENLSPLFLLNAKKSAVPGVDRNDLHTIQVVLPEIEEQNAIADYLEIEERKYLAMSAKVDDAITRLTEYRTALITAATTGKIDVRQIEVPAQA